MYARQQREGYGFRPKSGQTTPTGSSNGPAFSPFVTVSGGRGDDDDMDHRPDGMSMDDLREDIRGELARIGLDHEGEESHGEGNDMALSLVSASSNGHGIADEEGLGWPGQLPAR